MKENLSLTTAALIKWITLAVVFITPLLFVPWTFDFYEFPKQVLLWIAAAVLLVLWLVRFVANDEVKVIKTPIDLPLLLFILVSAVSLFLSSSRYTSLVGFFGRPDNGFAAIVAYAIIFYVASSTLHTVRDVVHIIVSFLLSMFVLALLGVLYYFGIYVFPWQSSHVNTFSPAGGMYALTVLLAMAVPAGLGLLLYRGNRRHAVPQLALNEPAEPVQANTATNSIYLPLLAIVVFAAIAVVALLGNWAGWIGLVIAAAVFFLWSKRGQMRATLPYILAITVAAVLWIIVAGIPQVRSHIPGLNQSVTPPNVLSASESWYIAGSALRDLPFFGSGPATYLYDFTRYHSTAYNMSQTWTLRYLVAHDQYLQILTTLGVLGFAAYLFFVVRILLFGFRTALKNRDVPEYPLKVGIFAGLVAYLAATLFVVPTTAVTFSFFVLLIILMGLEKFSGTSTVSDRKLAFVLTTPDQPTVTTTPNNVVPILLLIPGILLALVIFFGSTQYVRANVDYVRGVNALSSNKSTAAQDALVAQTQAVQTNPWEDGYHRDLARTSFNIALAVSQKKNLTDTDKQTVTALLQSAISQAQRAASLAPLDANNWQTLADIYRNIAMQVQGAGDYALAAYQQALLVDQDPQLLLNAGGIYYAAGVYDRAIDEFRQAVALKPNYANAYYNLANAYVKKGDYNDAYAAYQIAQSVTQSLPDSDPSKKTSLETLQKEMAAIADKVSTQSATPAQSGQAASPSPSPKATATPAAQRTSTPTVTQRPVSTVQPSATPGM